MYSLWDIPPSPSRNYWYKFFFPLLFFLLSLLPTPTEIGILLPTVTAPARILVFLSTFQSPNFYRALQREPDDTCSLVRWQNLIVLWAIISLSVICSRRWHSLNLSVKVMYYISIFKKIVQNNGQSMPCSRNLQKFDRPTENSLSPNTMHHKWFHVTNIYASDYYTWYRTNRKLTRNVLCFYN